MSDRHVWKNVYIKPSLLKADPTYQRRVDDKRIKRILDNWNYDLVRPPMVSQRIDGSYYVVDGQHTKVAWGIHENNAPILCKVCGELSHDEEVELFLKQFGESEKVSIGDLSRAKFNRGDQDEVIMVESAKAAGVEISFNLCRGRNKTAAIQACMNSIKKIGALRFTNALSILRDAWDGDQTTLGASFINGMVELYDKNEDKIDRAHLISVLGRRNPNHYIRSAQEHKGSVGRRYAMAFCDEYNRTARKNKLSVV